MLFTRKLFQMAFGVIVLRRIMLVLCNECPNWSEKESEEEVSVYLSKCYHFIEKGKPWEEASKKCKINGGKLISIRNKAENDFIIKAFPQMSDSCVWIGVKNSHLLQKTLLYAYGVPTVYLNLKKLGFMDWWKLPLFDCFAICLHRTGGSQAGQWELSQCDTPWPYICQTERLQGNDSAENQSKLLPMSAETTPELPTIVQAPAFQETRYEPERTAKTTIVTKIESMDGCLLQTRPDIMTREPLASRCVRKCVAELSLCKFINFSPSANACMGFTDLALEKESTECHPKDDWEGVKIYAVQCLSKPKSEFFYKALAEKTGGRHLKLDEFPNIFDFLMAICYREKGAEFLEDYEAEVRARTCKPHLDKDLEGLFGALRDTVPDAITPPPSLGEPVFPTKIPTTDTGIAQPKKVSRARLTKPRRVNKPRNIRSKKSPKFPKLARTKVPHSNFLLNNMAWSPWKLVISGTKVSENLWRKRNGSTSYRRKQAYQDMRSKAVYEFSVQKQKGARREVVFFKITNGLDSPQSWETKLLRDGFVREKINSAVSNGCYVFIRRAVLKRSQRVNDLRRKLKTKYCYSWIKTKSKYM